MEHGGGMGTPEHSPLGFAGFRAGGVAGGAGPAPIERASLE